MTTKRITAALLRKHGACEEQVAVFEAEWPDGAEPIKANIRRAIALGLDVGWIENLLRPKRLTAYRAACAPHRITYAAACAPHWAAYEAACAPHLAAYEAARNLLWTAYKAACAQSRIAYEAACAPDRAVYKDACAQHWSAYGVACAPHRVAYETAAGTEFIRQWKLQEAKRMTT